MPVKYRQAHLLPARLKVQVLRASPLLFPQQGRRGLDLAVGYHPGSPGSTVTRHLYSRAHRLKGSVCFWVLA